MTLEPRFSKYIPEKKDLEQGVLYISLEYHAVIHLCPCGCGWEVSTPITETGWQFENEDGLVSLSPSIGNFQYPCKSHYFIKKNEVIWA